VLLGAERGSGEWRPGGRLRARIGSLPPRWSAVALAVLLAGGAALLIYETRGTIFWADEWEWILNRRGGGLDSLLAPHNQHLSLIPVLIYKLLFATAGLRHYWPYRGLLVASELICVSLIFVYARRRVGGFYALLAVSLILFFGPAWQDILWPFQSAWILTVAAGVGALLALDRGDRAGDVVACVLLSVALASASPGLAIAAGLTVEVLLRRRWKDLWIVALPIFLYALWWLSYQQSVFNRHSLVLLPRFMFNSAAGTLSALTGLAQVTPYNDSGGDFLSWGAPLLLLGLVALVWRLRVLQRIPPRVVTLGTVLLAFWLLTGVGRAYVSLGPVTLTLSGHESRYLYIGAVFVVLLVVELARARASDAPAVAAAIGILTAAAILSNLGPLQDGAGLIRNQTEYTKAELETMNLTRNIVPADYVSNGFIFGIVRAGGWFGAEQALGSPDLSAPGLAQQPGFARQAADSQLLKIQGPVLQSAAPSTLTGPNPPGVDAVASGSQQTVHGCVRFRPDPFTPSGIAASLAVTVPPGGLLVRDVTGTASVGLRRFFPQFSELATIAPGGAIQVKLKADLAPQPWHAQITGTGSVTVCSLG
jgi:hypothetical protein